MKKPPTKTQHPQPPSHLSKDAKAWWAELMAEYALDDPAAQAILTSAAEARDRGSEALKIIDKEGITKTDRFGQVKQHPAFLCWRDAQTTMLKSLAALCLDIEPPKSVGRPPGGAHL